MNDLILRKVIRVYADTSVFGGVMRNSWMEVLYNAINTLHGYPQINIFSPLEVIRYEDN